MKPIVIITWKDAWHSGGTYYNKSNDHTPMIIHDIGYLMEENDETIVIAASIDVENENYRHLNVIPWDMVVKVEELIL